MKQKIVVKVKPKKAEKTVYYEVGFFQYLCCPHCKEMLILAPKKERDVLRKWKKVKV